MKNLYTTKPDDYYSLDRSMLLPFVPEGLKTILDVGCGEGAFAKKLRQERQVAHSWGVEFFDGAIPQASKNLDKVIHAPIETALAELPSAYFDCVFFNDVLEHLIDPYSVLKDIRAKVKTDGYVIASIPNILNFETLYQFIKTRDWQYKDYGIMDRTHLRFFTKKSIVRMFREAGYDVELIQGINKFYGRKFALLNFVFFNSFDEMKYVQWVIRAKPLKEVK
jgi:2-polyprenyl-3-methyl-5-hydroxy-6-metoxy-1,4-benzoquinol methylase